MQDDIKENIKENDGSLFGDPSQTSPEKDGVKWQKPRLTRRTLMKCCLVKWILSSTSSQGPEKRKRKHFSGAQQKGVNTTIS